MKHFPREATTRFELKSHQKNRVERGLLGTLILVAPNLHQTARRDSITTNVQEPNETKGKRTLSNIYLQTVNNLNGRKEAVKEVVCEVDIFHFFTASSSLLNHIIKKN